MFKATCYLQIAKAGIIHKAMALLTMHRPSTGEQSVLRNVAIGWLVSRHAVRKEFRKMMPDA